MSRLHREWRIGLAAFWWHRKRNADWSADFDRHFAESDRRLQALDARDRYRRQRRAAA